LDLAHTVADRRAEMRVGGLVATLRQSPHGDGTRIALDLAANAYRRAFFLPEPFRIIVDIATHPPHRGLSAGPVRAIERVVLDPGHGGGDSGAVGPAGVKEKDVTLDIAHRAAPILARELGILTLLTRDNDRTVALDERTARANGFHADLFVSIHCNASESAGAHGVMTFVLDASRDELAARIAARENATAVSAAPEVTSISRDLQLGDSYARSTRFAELLQRATIGSVSKKFPDTPDLGIRTAGFFVLVGAEMPAVLYETSFISNSVEEARLATPEYRQKLADSIVNAVRAFREGH
jgi:N-acetylmuramoyl-L-alanine amidase